MNLDLEEYKNSEVQLTTLMIALKLIYDNQLKDSSLIIKDNFIFKYDNKRNQFYDKDGAPFTFYPDDLDKDILLIEPNEVEII